MQGACLDSEAGLAAFNPQVAGSPISKSSGGNQLSDEATRSVIRVNS